MALAAFEMRVQWLIRGAREPAANPAVRVSMVLRRGVEGWKLVHYVESPLGALPLMRRLYRDHVTPGFAAAAAGLVRAKGQAGDVPLADGTD